ncbi:MAG: hypothetical protein EPO06_03145 [Burkholderiaceae bacterium]|nr:MAG: hypothetical protein EPO06_03145 [Burkholderiaceae bacterium]
MNQAIYKKTERGRTEVRARRLALSHKLRALLVMIDGAQTVAAYLEKLHGFGIGEEAFTQLERDGLIEKIPTAQPVDATAPITAGGPTTAGGLTDPEADQRRRIYNFYNSTIRDTIGLRGFMLQLDVEKATTLEDYRALRERFVAAVGKSVDPDTARRLQEELDRLLAENG